VKKGKINLIILLSLIITFASLVVIIWAVIKFNIASREILKNLKTPQEVSIKGISPSEVLNQKSAYSGKKITLRGKVTEAPVVCQKKDCPPDDACCGCPWERNLILLDEKGILTSQTKERLLLLDKEGKSFCQRQKGSCRYQCGDWKEGGIYEVYGDFWAETPPPGWGKSMDFYFKVEDKKLIKNLGLGGKINLLIQDIKNLFKALKTSGEYVLP
jgi:hypothetical protein